MNDALIRRDRRQQERIYQITTYDTAGHQWYFYQDGLSVLPPGGVERAEVQTMSAGMWPLGMPVNVEREVEGLCLLMKI